MDHLRSLNEIRVQRNIGISAFTLEKTGVLKASLFCSSSNHFFPLQENCNRIQKLDSWLRALKKESRLVLQAVAQAQKAADNILGETKDQSIDEN
jgi:antirestriction protein ArdC